MITSTVVMRLSCNGKDVTRLQAWKAHNHCKPANEYHCLIIHRPFSYPLAYQSQQDRVLIEEVRIAKWHATPTDPWGTHDLAQEITVVGITRFDAIL